VTLKRCSRCGETKALDQFGRLKKSPDGRAYYCKGCVQKMNRAAYVGDAEARKAYQRNYYNANKERASAQKKEHYARNREEILVQARKYNAARREEKRAAAKAWREANPERAKAANARYAREHAEEISAYGKTYREANRESIRTYQQQYRRENIEKFKANDNKRKLARFGLDEKSYAELLASQSGRCRVCGERPRGKRLCVDHKHIPGYAQMKLEVRRSYVRGLLCDRCNRMIGLFDDSAELLNAAIAYLRRQKELVRA
jgi:hypothetical protein